MAPSKGRPPAKVAPPAPVAKPAPPPSSRPGAVAPPSVPSSPRTPAAPRPSAPRAPTPPRGGGGGGGGRGGGGKPPVFTFNPRPPGSPPIKLPPDGPPDIPGVDMGPRVPPGGPPIIGEIPPVPTDTDREEMPEPVFDPYAAVYAAEQAQEQQNVIAVVTALFKEYGLESLTPKIIEYVKAGYNSEAIGVLLRDTPEYKARFPAMATLMQKKRAISEAQYIAYERQAAQLEKQYGLPSGMVQGNVTRLLENEVSATELNDRIIMASSAAVSAPEDLKQTLQRYYNVGTGGLAGYFLDPAIAAPILEKQFQTAQIGTEAVRQGIEVDVYGAQNLQDLGITQEAARQGFQAVAGARGLTAGRGDVVSQQQLISGTFGNEQQQQEIERVRAARRGRFAGGGEFMAERGGVTGLASATT